MRVVESRRQDVQRLGSPINSSLERILERVWARHIDHLNLYTQASGCLFSSFHIQSRSIWIGEHRDAFHARDNLGQDFQALWADLRVEERQAGQISSRAREGIDDAGSNCISERGKYDGNAGGGLSGCTHGRSARRDDNIYVQSHEFGGQCGDGLWSTVG